MRLYVGKAGSSESSLLSCEVNLMHLQLTICIVTFLALQVCNSIKYHIRYPVCFFLSNAAFPLSCDPLRTIRLVLRT